MSARNDAGKLYHNECTGAALHTVKQHEETQDITLFGSCFCPFVQRVWVAFEYLGIPYKVGTLAISSKFPLTSDPTFIAVARSIVSAFKTMLKALIADQLCRWSWSIQKAERSPWSITERPGTRTEITQIQSAARIEWKHRHIGVSRRVRPIVGGPFPISVSGSFVYSLAASSTKLSLLPPLTNPCTPKKLLPSHPSMLN